MLIRNVIKRITGENRLRELAQTVAQSCGAAIWTRVEGGIENMSTPETRGYVRGRAGIIVRRQVSVAAQHNEVKPSRHSRLLELTMQSVIDGMIQRKLAHTHVPALKRAA